MTGKLRRPRRSASKEVNCWSSAILWRSKKCVDTAGCNSAEIASTLLAQRCIVSPSSFAKPPFCSPVPQAQDKQALLCNNVCHSFGPLGDRVCSAQYCTTGKPPPISGVLLVAFSGLISASIQLPLECSTTHPSAW